MQDERDRRIAKLEQEVADLRTMVTALLADNQRLREENAQLRTEVEDLRARLGQNSSNSSKPPSTDSPADREGRRDKPPSGQEAWRTARAQGVATSVAHPDQTSRRLLSEGLPTL